MASGMEAEAARRNSMNGHPTKSALCALCGQTFPPDELVPAEVIRPRLARLIRHEHPAWQDTDCICLGDLNRFRMDYVRQVIEAEVGELSVLEEDVVKSLKEHEVTDESSPGLPSIHHTARVRSASANYPVPSRRKAR